MAYDNKLIWLSKAIACKASIPSAKLSAAVVQCQDTFKHPALQLPNWPVKLRLLSVAFACNLLPLGKALVLPKMSTAMRLVTS